jgi:hypothetical protein
MSEIGGTPDLVGEAIPAEQARQSRVSLESAAAPFAPRRKTHRRNHDHRQPQRPRKGIYVSVGGRQPGGVVYETHLVQ